MTVRPRLRPRARHARALPFIAAKPFDETLADFVEGWGHVRTPAGFGSLADAWQIAVSAPPPPEADGVRDPRMKLLISLCRELQRQVGDRPFFLSCRDPATALALPGDEPHVTAWRWLNVLCEKGVLVKGKVGTLEGRRATEFRYPPPISHP